MPLPVMRKGGPTLPLGKLYFDRSPSGAPTQQCDHTWFTSGGLQRTSGGESEGSSAGTSAPEERER
eukprot:4510064-Alexandrium_andersonii.AAC.1